MLKSFPRRRDLAITLTGRMVSAFGDGVALVALTLRLQGDGAQPYEISLLLAGGMIPLLLVARHVGRLVDAHDSRVLLIAGGLVQTAVTIPLIFVHGLVPMVLLVGALGAVASLTSATWSALLPRVSGEEHLAQAISIQQASQALVLVGGPAVGGILAGAFGTGVPIIVDAASFLAVTAAAVMLTTRRAPMPQPLSSSDQPPQIADGFSILRADRVLARCSSGSPSSCCWLAWSM